MRCTTVNNSQTALRHDLPYLRCILTHATKHHTAQTPKDRLTQATLQDYLTWLTTDALKNKQQARHTAPTLARLQEELHTQTKHSQTQNTDPTPHAYYEGYLHALENTLNHHHREDLLLHEEITRQQFQETWEKTRKTLGL